MVDIRSQTKSNKLLKREVQRLRNKKDTESNIETAPSTIPRAAPEEATTVKHPSCFAAHEKPTTLQEAIRKRKRRRSRRTMN